MPGIGPTRFSTSSPSFNPVRHGAIAKGEYDKFDTFVFSDEAQKVFIDWSTELNREKITNEDDAIIRQHLAKFDSLFCSLALIFHLIDCAAHGLRGPVSRASAIRAAAGATISRAMRAAVTDCFGTPASGRRKRSPGSSSAGT